MPGHAFLPPAGLSGTQSLLKGQQVTEDARIRTICQMENTAALHPFLTPLNGSRELLRMFSDVSAGTGVRYRRVCTDLTDVGWRI